MNRAPRSTYQQGDHVCTLYETREEQLAAAVEYIRGGLARGERCLYVCGEHSPEELRAALAGAGVAVRREESRGALLLVTKRDAHLKEGDFDPARMVALLRNAVEESLRGGFAGLCAAGDMNWVLDGERGTEKLREYESLLNDFYPTNRALGLCQYNRRTFPARFLDDSIATHRHVRVDGPLLLTNPFFGLSEDDLARETMARKLRLIHSAV